MFFVHTSFTVRSFVCKLQHQKRGQWIFKRFHPTPRTHTINKQLIISQDKWIHYTSRCRAAPTNMRNKLKYTLFALPDTYTLFQIECVEIRMNWIAEFFSNDDFSCSVNENVKNIWRVVASTWIIIYCTINGLNWNWLLAISIVEMPVHFDGRIIQPRCQPYSSVSSKTRMHLSIRNIIIVINQFTFHFDPIHGVSCLVKSLQFKFFEMFSLFPIFRHQMIAFKSFWKAPTREKINGASPIVSTLFIAIQVLWTEHKDTYEPTVTLEIRIGSHQYFGTILRIHYVIQRGFNSHIFQWTIYIQPDTHT